MVSTTSKIVGGREKGIFAVDGPTLRKRSPTANTRGDRRSQAAFLHAVCWPLVSAQERWHRNHTIDHSLQVYTALGQTGSHWAWGPGDSSHSGRYSGLWTRAKILKPADLSRLRANTRWTGAAGAGKEGSTVLRMCEYGGLRPIFYPLFSQHQLLKASRGALMPQQAGYGYDVPISRWDIIMLGDRLAEPSRRTGE
jgi:hypothetical protein